MFKEGQTHTVKNNIYAKEIGVISDATLYITCIEECVTRHRFSWNTNFRREKIYFTSNPSDGYGNSFLYKEEFEKLLKNSDNFKFNFL